MIPDRFNDILYTLFIEMEISNDINPFLNSNMHNLDAIVSVQAVKISVLYLDID